MDPIISLAFKDTGLPVGKYCSVDTIQYILCSKLHGVTSSFLIDFDPFCTDWFYLHCWQWLLDHWSCNCIKHLLLLDLHSQDLRTLYILIDVYDKSSIFENIVAVSSHLFALSFKAPSFILSQTELWAPSNWKVCVVFWLLT